LALVLATIVVSAAPFLLNLAGVDFSSRGPAIDVQELQNESSRSISTSVLVSSSGQFTHTILEWSAFCAALFTVILACSFYSIRKEPVMPVIGTSLFCVGIMDAFHTLAADHLISGVADQSDLIPFTWAICRVFNAGIIIAGTSIFLTRKSDSKKSGLSFVVTIPLLFGLVAYALIHLCATSARLRRTTRTSSSVRPERRFTVAKGAPKGDPFSMKIAPSWTVRATKGFAVGLLRQDGEGLRQRSMVSGLSGKPNPGPAGTRICPFSITGCCTGRSNHMGSRW
jgi:hypothetical protein